jgi:hypothetical protein
MLIHTGQPNGGKKVEIIELSTYCRMGCSNFIYLIVFQTIESWKHGAKDRFLDWLSPFFDILDETSSDAYFHFFLNEENGYWSL